MWKQLTEQEIAEMFEDMEYNDRMSEYIPRLAACKRKFTETFYGNTALCVIVLVGAIIDTDNETNFVLLLAALIAIFALTTAAVIKREPLIYFAVSLISVVFGFIMGSIMLFIMMAVNVLFYLLTRDIYDVKKLEGYPHFAYKIVRHKN
ncbi:MAG: hypothetical protein ACI4JW_11285 [Oscillospiraceae bacterium]